MVQRNSRETRTRKTKTKDKQKIDIERATGGNGGVDDYTASSNHILDGGELSDNYSIADDNSDADTYSQVSLHDEDILAHEQLGNNIDTDAILSGEHKPHGIDGAEQQAALFRLQKLHDTLSNLDEYSSEKRSAKREIILRRVFRAITHYATGYSGQEKVLDNCDTIRMACFHSIRIGQPTEQYAACRVIEATSVVLGSDQEHWVESLTKQLHRVVMAYKTVAVRSAALRAYCMAVCINSDDTVLTERTMDLCEEVANGTYRNEIVSSSLRASAIDCWTLLASTIDDFDLSGQSSDQVGRGLAFMPILKECLDNNDPNPELRSAAGQCLALIHEARLNIGIVQHDAENAPSHSENDDDDHHHHNDNNANMTATQRKYQRGSWENSALCEDLMEEIKIRIDELSNQTGHYMSKQAKKEQRKTFREYMSTICDNESPEETLYFNKNNINLTLTTWKEIIQLEFVRHCFQGGFQIQLLTNNTLQLMFGLSGATNDNNTIPSGANDGYSALEKRLYLSKTSEVSKLAHIKLTKERQKRQNVKNHFLTADGDDI